MESSSLRTCSEICESSRTSYEVFERELIVSVSTAAASPTSPPSSLGRSASSPPRPSPASPPPLPPAWVYTSPFTEYVHSSSSLPGLFSSLCSLSSRPQLTPSSFLLCQSAPDIANQNIANPIGTILSAALMLRYSLGRPKEAELIETAVRKVLDAKDLGGEDLRTRDLGGESGTIEIGDRVVKVLERLLASQ